jgi:hypothetical protein
LANNGAARRKGPIKRVWLAWLRFWESLADALAGRSQPKPAGAWGRPAYIVQSLAAVGIGLSILIVAVAVATAVVLLVLRLFGFEVASPLPVSGAVTALGVVVSILFKRGGP